MTSVGIGIGLAGMATQRRAARRLLILAASCRGALAGGAEEVWYEHEYERSFVEVLLLIFMVLLALVFEMLWHQCIHKAERSYFFGSLQDRVEGSQGHGQHDMKHVVLPKELVNRASSEFMTLGFLAFCLFSFNSGGGFEWMVDEFQSGYLHLPRAPEDWLHMAEMVQINLFVGMVIYFIMMARVVQGAGEKLKAWEQLKMRHQLRGKPALETTVASRSFHRTQQHDAELAEYLHWRCYFVVKMGSFFEMHPDLLTDVLPKIGLSADSLSPQAGKEKDKGKSSDAATKFQDYLDREFAFGSYLAFSVEDGVLDAIRISPTTWVFLILFFVAFAAVHRWLHIALPQLMPAFIALAMLLMTLMQGVVNRNKAAINRFTLPQPGATKKGPERSAGSWLDFGVDFTGQMKELRVKHDTEALVMQCLQIALFLTSYVFARALLDLHLWSESPLEALLYTFLFTVLFAFLMLALPESVPLFLGMMAMPPYLDQTNIATFCTVLESLKEQQQATLRMRAMTETLGKEEAYNTRKLTGSSGDEQRPRQPEVFVCLDRSPGHQTGGHQPAPATLGSPSSSHYREPERWELSV